MLYSVVDQGNIMQLLHNLSVIVIQWNASIEDTPVLRTIIFVLRVSGIEGFLL